MKTKRKKNGKVFFFFAVEISFVCLVMVVNAGETKYMYECLDIKWLRFGFFDRLKIKMRQEMSIK